ncbi:Cupin-domain-containing oxidoreductase virC [Paramyrothecium foliicola]|nr:Cupin-domain-containing oxidoreductase virC [Paramyrothecium foliicola]
MDITGYALVIGGGSGIGRACAVLLAREGAAGLLIADLNAESAAQAAIECSAVSTVAGFRAEAVFIDVTSEDTINEVLGHMQKLFGRIDYCVNCAGIGVTKPGEISDADFSEFSRFLKIHVEGSFLVTRRVSSIMRNQDPQTHGLESHKRGTTRGAIVILGSASSFVASPSMVQYTTAKHAVLGLAKNAAKHLAVEQVVEKLTVDQPTPEPAAAEAVNPALLISAGYISTDWPAPGLRRNVRHITGHNSDGKGIFLSTDCGDHFRMMGNQQALANIIYSTKETPVDLNGDADLKYAKENEPPLHIHNGTVVRMIDFAPNVESPMHRAVSLDYGIVIEGEFKLILDSGEERIMRQGDVSVQRATAHRWHNITANGTGPGRMMWVLLDCKPVIHNGEALPEYLGDLTPYYENRS